MTDRTIQPSALPAEYSERKSDQTHCYAYRPRRDRLLEANRKLREELDEAHKLIRDVTEILTAINGEPH